MSAEKVDISISINSRKHSIAGIPADLSLLDFLGEKLGLTGTKFCCGIGVCRACTVVLWRTPGSPPVPILACSTPVAQVNGQAITTVEGLSPDPGQLSLLQQAFLDAFAFQCGYCTPGLLMAAHALIERLRLAPVERGQVDRTILETLGDHICRCTGYVLYHHALRKVILSTPGLVREP